MEPVRSIINDPDHIPQKKDKVVKELPNGRFISKNMQKMVSSGLKEVKDDHLHNCLIKQMEDSDKPMYTHYDLELYWINDTIMIYDNGTNQIFITKDSDPSDLTPEYWDKILKS